MNTISTRIQKIIWTLALVSSLGAMVYLSFTSWESISKPTNIAPLGLEYEPDWVTIYAYGGKTFYYNDNVGLIMPGEGSGKTFFEDWSDNSKLWGVIQLLAVSVGLVLVVIKRPATIKPIHRLNIAFGYITVTWLNAFVVAFRMMGNNSEIPPGYMLIAPPSGQIISTKPDVLLLIVLGVGISLMLGYAFVRWARADNPEEIFV